MMAVVETPWRFTLLGYQLGFAHPWYLGALPLALLLGAIALVYALTRRDRIERAIAPRLVPKLAPGVSLALPSLQASLYTLGLSCLGVALAQPQCGSHSELTKRRGIDVVVAIDASKSMLARDVQPSRLDRAKLELGSLLDELKGDRVAIIDHGRLIDSGTPTELVGRHWLGLPVDEARL